MWCFQYPFFFHLISSSPVNHLFHMDSWNKQLLFEKVAIFISLLPPSDFWHTLFSIWPKEKRIWVGNRERRREREDYINILNSLSLSVRNTPIKSILIHTINLLSFNLYYEGITWLKIHQYVHILENWNWKKAVCNLARGLTN